MNDIKSIVLALRCLLISKIINLISFLIKRHKNLPRILQLKVQNFVNTYCFSATQNIYELVAKILQPTHRYFVTFKYFFNMLCLFILKQYKLFKI